MTDRITPHSGTKAVSSPDGNGQGCASTKRAYVKPELILLYGNAGAGQATNGKGTANNKSSSPSDEDVSGIYHYGPS